MQKLKTLFPNIPVLMLTALGTTEDSLPDLMQAQTITLLSHLNSGNIGPGKKYC